MKTALISAGAVAISATIASAGGVERSAQPMGVLFEQGRYLEVSMGVIDPTVSGSLGGGLLPTGDIAESYSSLAFAYKMDFTPTLSMAVIVDEPIGANVFYPNGTGYPFAGATAIVDSTAVTGVLRYRFASGFSVYGGARVVRTQGTVSLPGYTVSTNNDVAYGYLVGIAYERPDIALRVALTYNSEITHDFASIEQGFVPGAFSTSIPQSLNLEFQSGVAANTLVFGSIRYVDWNTFNISPPNFPSNPLVAYNGSSMAYNIGVGRRFTDNWSGAVTTGYETGTGNPMTNLGPTNGRTSVGLGVTYTQGPMSISGGVQYIWLGNAITTIGADFSDNTAVAAGVRIGFHF
jgi:long-chain fatty acid transport protein